MTNSVCAFFFLHEYDAKNIGADKRVLVPLDSIGKGMVGIYSCDC